MQDLEIKGTGNSRFLKSSVPATTTWEDFLTMLRAGNLPIDLTGLNSAGIITQNPSAYNKANVLPDDVCDALGIDANTSEVKDAFLSLNTKLSDFIDNINQFGKVYFFSYVGTGVYGTGKGTSITFPYAPQIIMLTYGRQPGTRADYGTLFNYNDSNTNVLDVRTVSTTYSSGKGFGYANRSDLFCKKSEDGKTVSWYVKDANYAARQYNHSGETYYGIAFL